jgi:hypothetical protein
MCGYGTTSRRLSSLPTHQFGGTCTRQSSHSCNYLMHVQAPSACIVHSLLCRCIGQYRKLNSSTGVQHHALHLGRRPIYKQVVMPSETKQAASFVHAPAWIYYSEKYRMWVVGPVAGGFNKLWLAVNSSARAIEQVRSGWIVFEHSVWHKVSSLKKLQTPSVTERLCAGRLQYVPAAQ